MSSSRNLLASISYSAWSAIASLAAVPLLIRFMGVEAYGLIGLYTSAQGVLFLLDMGLAPAVNREVARNSARGAYLDSAQILRTLAPVYVVTALVIAAGFFMFAPAIAGLWLNVEKLSLDTVIHSLVLIGLMIACRWPASLYQNALIGAGRLTITSGIGILTVTLANAGGVFVVAFLSPSPETYFLWQLICMLLHTYLMRRFCWSVIGHFNEASKDFGIFKDIWKFSAGMAGVSLTAVLLMQLDKIFLSRMLPLEDLGHYAVASLVASGLYIILTPTFNTIFPLFSRLIVEQRTEELRRTYCRGTRILVCALFPSALGLVFFSRELLVVWTGDVPLAVVTAPVLSLLLLGTALNGAMHLPYALQLASGASWVPLVINLCLLMLFVPLLIVFTNRFGLTGGAAAWMSLNILYLFAGSIFTHRLLLRGIELRWLLIDVLTPLMLSGVTLYLAKNIVHEMVSNDLVRLALGAILSLLVIALNFAALLPQESKTFLTRAVIKMPFIRSN